MVEKLAEAGVLRSPCWSDAFAAVPREVFAPSFQIRTSEGKLEAYTPESEGYGGAVYTDTSLITQWDAGGTATSSSSQPSLMARMLEAFDVPNGERVLEIGTGTGYNTALLCRRYGDAQVVSVDVDPALTEAAREKLDRIEARPLLLTADGTLGHGDEAPYGGILATCGVRRIPAAWLAQVRPGGLIVANIGTGIAQLTVTEDGDAEGGFLPEPAAFMVARPTPEHVTASAASHTSLILNGTGRTRTAELPDARRFCERLVMAEALEIALSHQNVLAVSFLREDGSTVCGLVHPETGSWSRTVADGDSAEVTWNGPRDLWEERSSLLSAWEKAGCPGPDAYRLAVDADGRHTLTRPVRWEL
ncbi:methyltransferase domain-containing protein [Streptomyces sp. UNOC14_S4]|nr:methyltransferase domain-containing protein [Streptomyces sp. UNOC14_S4]